MTFDFVLKPFVDIPRINHIIYEYVGGDVATSSCYHDPLHAALDHATAEFRTLVAVDHARMVINFIFKPSVHLRICQIIHDYISDVAANAYARSLWIELDQARVEYESIIESEQDRTQTDYYALSDAHHCQHKIKFFLIDVISGVLDKKNTIILKIILEYNAGIILDHDLEKVRVEHYTKRAIVDDRKIVKRRIENADFAFKIAQATWQGRLETLSPFLEHPKMASLVRSYAGNYQLAYSAQASLNRQVRADQVHCRNFEPHHFLQDEAGLTGICLSYALHCVPWVMEIGERTPLPPLMPGIPTERMRDVQKLLLLAAYREMGRGVDPSTIKPNKENRLLIERITRTYISLQRPLTGVDALRAFPNYGEPSPLAIQLSDFRRLSAERVGNGHYIFIMMSSERALLDWHVIYVNPDLGIIGDAYSSTLWKIDEAARCHFHDIFASFCMHYPTSFDRATIIHLEYTPLARKESTPSLLSRMCRRAETAYYVALKTGPLSSMRYMMSLHRHNPAVVKLFPTDGGMKNHLQTIFKEECSPIEVLYDFVLRNSHYVSLWKKDPWIFGLYSFEKLVKNLLDNPAEVRTVLAQIEKLDLRPETYDVSTCLQKTLLATLSIDGNYPPHIINRLIPDLLALRKHRGRPYPLALRERRGKLYPLALRKYREKPYPLDDLMNIPFTAPRHLPYYRLLVAEGANINGGKCDKDRKPPYHEVLSEGWGWKFDKKGTAALLAFFRSRGARELK